MGQYYLPVIIPDGLGDVKVFEAHHYDNGLKLMEHSWMGNGFVDAVLAELARSAAPYKRLIWLGDYAAYHVEPEDECAPGLIDHNPDAKEIISEEMFKSLMRLHGREGEQYAVPPSSFGSVPHSYRYVLNYTKKEYIDLEEHCKIMNREFKCDDWVPHPIPLLCAVGNGNGGGDYFGEHADAVGRWAGDVLIPVDELPKTDFKSAGWCDITGWYPFKE